ncbi:hypothetical protein E4U58_004367 [Claviceps cyperi]|nr:hypothetical protein E4U58_004367 [Claviceps cyperi]
MLLWIRIGGLEDLNGEQPDEPEWLAARRLLFLSIFPGYRDQYCMLDCIFGYLERGGGLRPTGKFAVGDGGKAQIPCSKYSSAAYQAATPLPQCFVHVRRLSTALRAYTLGLTRDGENGQQSDKYERKTKAFAAQ